MWNARARSSCASCDTKAHKGARGEQCVRVSLCLSHSHAHTHTRTRTHTLSHSYTHTHAHAHAHAHTHTHTSVSSSVALAEMTSCRYRLATTRERCCCCCCGGDAVLLLVGLDGGDAWLVAFVSDLLSAPATPAVSSPSSPSSQSSWLVLALALALARSARVFMSALALRVRPLLPCALPPVVEAPLSPSAYSPSPAAWTARRRRGNKEPLCMHYEHVRMCMPVCVLLHWYVCACVRVCRAELACAHRKH